MTVVTNVDLFAFSSVVNTEINRVRKHSVLVSIQVLTFLADEYKQDCCEHYLLFFLWQ